MNPTKQDHFGIRLWERLQKEKYDLREAKRIDTLNSIIKPLKTYFADKCVRSVYLFGSVLKEGKFYEFSDIDIVVEGFGEDYFAILRELEDLVDRDVDLVELDGSRLGDLDRNKWIVIK